MFGQKDILRVLSSENDSGHLGTPLQSPTGGNSRGLNVDQESTKPQLYSSLPKTSSQVQPPKDSDGAHMGTPVKPVKQPQPSSNTSGGMAYGDYDY